jgi:hypothetical protein
VCYPHQQQHGALALDAVCTLFTLLKSPCCHDEGDKIRTTKHDCCRATRRNAFVLSDLRHARSHEHMRPERIQTPRNHNSLLRTFESPAADTLAPPTLPNRLCGVGVGQLHGCVYGAERLKEVCCTLIQCLVNLYPQQNPGCLYGWASDRFLCTTPQGRLGILHGKAHTTIHCEACNHIL